MPPITSSTTSIDQTMDPSILNTVFSILKRKRDMIVEIKAIEKLEAIYRKEIQSVSHNLHYTRAGEPMLINTMSDTHLLATIKIYMRNSGDDIDDVPDKYLDEAKRRPGMIDSILGINTIAEDEGFELM